MEKKKSSSVASAEFPAAVVNRDSILHRWVNQSTNLFVLLALGGLVVAIAYAWIASSPEGQSISVHFPEGYGLEPDDAVRYRGITVGEVTDVRLASDLKGVVVEATLIPSAANLAREGSLFWVERAQVSLNGVRSLDTLMSGKYLSVIPGPADSTPVSVFAGEIEPPAILDPVEGGLSLTLISEERFGLERGSPITYRGLEAGQILHVALGESGHVIEARAVIFPEYRKLVRDNTKFWSRSGVDVKIGFRGVDMDLDPATALSSGAVAFAAPLPAGLLIEPGATFDLGEKEAEGWQDWKPLLDLGEAVIQKRRENVENGEAPSRPLLDRIRKAFESS